MSGNKIPALESDISENAANITDISTNTIPAIIQDINDIIVNKIPDIVQDINDISTNKIPAIKQNINDISVNKIPAIILDDSQNKAAITDISTN
jgi:hypothetical protein